MITLTDATFDEFVRTADVPVLADFWAEWCPPCHVVAKPLAELADELTGQVLIAKINADENPETTRRFRVMSLPTLLLFDNAVVVRTIVGARPKSVLRKALTEPAAYANN